MSCIVKNCKGKPVGRLSPDLDIFGIQFCKKHKTIVMAAYMSIGNDGGAWIKKLAGLSKDEK